jgi:NAD(P) transhydrogenase subunit beta
MEFNHDLFAAAYLVATILFIYGLKGLSSPKTALKGNSAAMLGMLLAVVATLIDPQVKSYTWVLVGLGAGAAIGIILALKISMTAMPQLVAALHSFVGLSAVLVAGGTYLAHTGYEAMSAIEMVELSVGSFIGAITFTGSLVAFGKLQELLKSNPLIFKGQHFLNAALALAMLAFTVHFTITGSMCSFLILTAIALALGFFTGAPDWRRRHARGRFHAEFLFRLGCFGDRIYPQQPLVDYYGGIGRDVAARFFPIYMCKAMNRSILSVIFGGLGSETAGGSEAAAAANKGVKSASVEDVAFMLENASKVIIIRGYGMAVAQASTRSRNSTNC